MTFSLVQSATDLTQNPDQLWDDIGVSAASLETVYGPSTNTDTNIPQWDGDDTHTLKDGLSFSTDTALGSSDTTVCSQNAIKQYADTKLAKGTNITSVNETGVADGEIAVFNLTNNDIRTSNKTIETTLGTADTAVPTSQAVREYANCLNEISETVTYASATTVTVEADVTSTFQKGMFLEWTQGGERRWGYIISSSYSNPTTTITVSPLNDSDGNIHEVDNSAITLVYTWFGEGWRSHPVWLNFDCNRTSTGTLPTYGATDMNQFMIANGTCYFKLFWRNSSGGTAGSGSDAINFDLPFVANEDQDDQYTDMGSAVCYESGGTQACPRISLGSNGKQCNFWFGYSKTTGQNVQCADQSSADRFISGSGFYWI